jgi:hypothetical protein
MGPSNVATGRPFSNVAVPAGALATGQPVG